MYYMEEQKIQYQEHNIFPTSIVSIRCDFSDSDRQKMMDSIDTLIENKLYHDDNLTPKYQTYLTLFEDDEWSGLKKSFYTACEAYLNVSKYANINTIKFIGADAWGYKSWKDVNGINPWHEHSPAYLSGVYYLKVPGHPLEGGTEFHDPVMTLKRRFVVHPQINSWCIFPGWLSHRSCQVDLNEPRYVVAANMYVRPQ